MKLILALARSPREGAAAVLSEGRLPVALAMVALATALSIAHTVRFAGEVAVEEIMFGPTRSPAVDVLLGLMGRDMTAVVLHLFQSSWTALLILGALAPVLIWLLGATAVHAAARLSGLRQPLQPMLVLFGYATGLTRPVADLAALASGTQATAISEIAGLAALAWLGLLAWRGIRAHYGLPGGRALTLLLVSLVFFYLAPLTLILLALIAVLAAAVLLEYVAAP